MGRLETWWAVEMALNHGMRGLPGDSSLPRVLAHYRGLRNIGQLQPLSLEQILAWADAHRKRTGDWPTVLAGSVDGAEGETWAGIHRTLRLGLRGLPGESSLARLLDEHRGTNRARNRPAAQPSVASVGLRLVPSVTGGNKAVYRSKDSPKTLL